LELAELLSAGPLHLDELAARTKTDAPSLFRLMRALQTIGIFTQVSPQLMSTLRKFFRRLVGARGFEPRTSCAQGLIARRTNDLHGTRRIATECYKCNVRLRFAAVRR